MHRHGVMYNNFNAHYPYCPHRHHGANVCSACDIVEPWSIPDTNFHTSPYYYDYAFRRWNPYIDYPWHNGAEHVAQRMPPVPVSVTNVHNDIYYSADEPKTAYEDDYGNAYKFSRSRVRLVDVVPESHTRTNSNPVAVLRKRSEERAERMIIPRTRKLRQTSLPMYERPRPVRLVPLYHSADTEYVATRRKSMKPKKLVPLATVYSSPNPQKTTIKLRSSSP